MAAVVRSQLQERALKAEALLQQIRPCFNKLREAAGKVPLLLILVRCWQSGNASCVTTFFRTAAQKCHVHTNPIIRKPYWNFCLKNYDVYAFLGSKPMTVILLYSFLYLSSPLHDQAEDIYALIDWVVIFYLSHAIVIVIVVNWPINIQ